MARGAIAAPTVPVWSPGLVTPGGALVGGGGGGVPVPEYTTRPEKFADPLVELTARVPSVTSTSNGPSSCHEPAAPLT